MGKFFVAKELNQLLQHWEEMMLYGELLFQIHQSGQNSVGSEGEKLFPMIGSELSEDGIACRSIPEFSQLRHMLAGRPYAHRTNWLPRVPKDWRTIFEDSYAMSLNYRQIKPVYRVPEFLRRWNMNRKAMIVGSGVDVPRINFKEENWLDRLPYSSFYLKLEDTHLMTETEDGRIWKFSNVLVFEDERYIRLFVWPGSDFEKFLMSPQYVSDIKKSISRVKKGHSLKNHVVEEIGKNRNFVYFTINLSKESKHLYFVHDFPPKHTFIDIYDESIAERYGDHVEHTYEYGREILEILNGFCKLIHHLPKGSTVVSTGEIPTREAVGQRPRQWFELPMQTVEAVTQENTKEIRISQGGGTEKSFHIREGHWRTITKKDGTKKDIWIDDMFVRADKESEEPLRGGAKRIT